MRENETHVTAMDKRAPMAAAPMRYLPDGAVDWGNMWDTFCVLARDGGPPHRNEMLYAQEDADVSSEAYCTAVSEIIRGVELVSGLAAAPAAPGWVAIACQSAAMAHWLSEAIKEENVQVRSEGATLYVPAGPAFTVSGEIKNVITAVAKTNHYWHQHLPAEVKQTLALQAGLEGLQRRLKRWFGKL